MNATEKKKLAAPSSKSITKKFRYGWVPDLPDQRDILYSAVRKVPAALPSKVDLRPICSKVEDQGNLGSCTGNALVGALWNSWRRRIRSLMRSSAGCLSITTSGLLNIVSNQIQAR